MAQFRGTIKGGRGGEGSRLGTKGSGLTVKANGWDTGVVVHLAHVDGHDRVTVLRTGGNHGGPEQTIATWDDQDAAVLAPDHGPEGVTMSPEWAFWRKREGVSA